MADQSTRRRSIVFAAMVVITLLSLTYAYIQGLEADKQRVISIAIQKEAQRQQKIAEEQRILADLNAQEARKNAEEAKRQEAEARRQIEECRSKNKK